MIAYTANLYDRCEEETVEFGSWWRLECFIACECTRGLLLLNLDNCGHMVAYLDGLVASASVTPHSFCSFSKVLGTTQNLLPTIRFHIR